VRYWLVLCLLAVSCCKAEKAVKPSEAAVPEDPKPVVEDKGDDLHDGVPDPDELTEQNICEKLGEVTCGKVIKCTQPEDRKPTIKDYKTCLKSWLVDHNCEEPRKWCVEMVYERFHPGEARKCLSKMDAMTCDTFLVTGGITQHCNDICQTSTTVVENEDGTWKTIYFDDAPLSAEEWREEGHPDYQ
jgi:hypothetical protein